MAASGAVLTLGYDGRLRVERGLIRPGDKPPVNGTSDDDHTVPGTGGEPQDKNRSRVESDRLIEDLTAHKTAALRAVIGDDTDVALTLIVHALALRLFGIGAEYQTCLTLSVAPEDLAQHAEGIAATPAMTAVEERHQRWGDRLPGETADLWGWLIAQSRDERLDLLAHCVGLLIHGVCIPHMGEGRRLAADRLSGLVGLDMADWWHPTKDSYLGRVPKARILDAVTEGASPDEASKLTGLKKAEMAGAAEALLKDRRWLPAALRTGNTNPATP